ncbi:MAG TPA: enoyl-CoA hydratase-related protein [Gaiellaceae bacterium]|nr:enoyl-CoA hydratase-related protein [Gaiellaceae bacterium]
MSADNTSVVRVERAETGVATIILDRPKVNAMNPELIGALQDAVDELATEPDVRALLIQGAGGRFCAGADIEVMSDHTPETYRAMRREVDVEDALERCGKPVVCAIERWALGGGAELALACDVRVMGKGAVFGFPEVDLGLFPGAGGTQRLTRLVGVSRAFWLLATGQRLSADEALAEGIATEVVDDEQVIARATEIAEQLARGPTRAIGLIKSLVYESWGRELPAGLEREGDAVFEVLSTEDLREGFQAFREKRPPRFTGR